VWQQGGKLPFPDAIKNATAEYQADSDQLSDFIRACCEVGADESNSSVELYAGYSVWCDSAHLGKWDRLSANAFGRLMSARFKKRHTMAGAVYIGISLKTGKLGWK
jgi:phage/plasmid-associated DNA primase